ncbi:MAG: phytanoyl-CoA dioxygenase family protein [Gammaproteobacteria bacterium]|nr:MAG: phytanoyl-CoA dioxygenase family protein [Gammaproteobacteria bacterium]
MQADRAVTEAVCATDLELAAQEREQYASDGYFVRPQAFSAADVAQIGDAVEAAAERALRLSDSGRSYILDGKRFVDVGHVTVQFEPPPDDPAIKVIEPVCELHPLLEALLDDARIATPMRGLLETDRIAMWTNKLNLKRPGVGSGFGWHQDSPYWIHDCGHVDRLPNAMLVLDDADADNGCFRVIRGSHTRGCLPGTADGSQLGGFYTEASTFDLADEVALKVPAGSLVFFHPHIVHGSLPNRSQRPRRALVLTYQPADQATLKSKTVRNIR